MSSQPIPAPAEATQPCIPRELLASPLFLLGRVGYGAKLRAMEAFEAAGYSPYGYGVLALLEEGARETQATIADTLKIDRSQLVGVLDGLEQQQLIERRRDPNDRRRHLVSITAVGKKQMSGFRKLAKQLEDELFAALTAEEREQLRTVLLRIAGSRDVRYVPPELRAVTATR